MSPSLHKTHRDRERGREKGGKGGRERVGQWRDVLRKRRSGEEKEREFVQVYSFKLEKVLKKSRWKRCERVTREMDRKRSLEHL